MRIEFKQLKELTVETQSGIYLGKVTNAHIDTDSHTILQYYVVKKRLLSRSPELLVSPTQVISITEDKLIVNNNVEVEQIAQMNKKNANLRTENATPLNAKTEQ
jgi:sporulation protein YlmC with PRC-barrel domain